MIAQLLKTFVLVDSCSFVIPGEPVSFPEVKSSYFKTWNGRSQEKVKYKITLEEQYSERKMMTGPLHMDVTFYFSEHKKHEHAMHNTKPNLSALVRFLESMCDGIVFQKDYLLSQISCSKLYDGYPRTEFTISRMIHE